MIKSGVRPAGVAGRVDAHGGCRVALGALTIPDEVERRQALHETLVKLREPV